ncbi:16S rRNA (cytidine(1402)-2'-O)-methyltransferase [Glaciecola sp. MH2013]|uniref:16S rRNA (cytidine(1402)-2'-O)-methyltransferase n=1 Tax=Glaciecola sp. MH2013 TaxID=2785524 RepID=UPI00189EBB0D|nr:16S rRNA (cytidine(1402)-2'-O)-methyltransferase [Glaciecola sp. MH2013]MBF7075045.1 16S rRNA (cytidine(1402)-2'-O)-methyltransferase [Glaciecola sp. MH2013]
MSMSGTLFIVPTPIGNLSDISSRALQILNDVDIIAAEDTRHSGRLLSHYAIQTATLSLHDHNESARAQQLIEKLKQGKSIALISDAGTPLISDPGYVFVRECRLAKLHVVALPGPCALTTALSASGLPTDRFTFRGFLPIKQMAKGDILQSLSNSGTTTIFYEAPRRIRDTIEACSKYLQTNHQIVLAKELTKTFETFKYGCADEILAWLDADPVHQKGEFVIMIYCPNNLQKGDVSPEAIALLKSLAEELPLKKAAAITAKHYGLKKNTLYNLGLDLKGD